MVFLGREGKYGREFKIKEEDFYIMSDAMGVYHWIAAHFIGLVVLGVTGFIVLNIVYTHREKSAAYKIIVFAAGVVYLAALLYLTLGMRSPQAEYTYELVLFWSYWEVFTGEEQWLLWENIANMFLFFPFGIFLYEWLSGKRKWYLCMIVVLCVSTGIELTQLLAKLGLFEFDDILHNTLGGILGYAAAGRITVWAKSLDLARLRQSQKQ